MDWVLFKTYIIGTMKMEFVIAFYLFAFLGMFLTLMFHLKDAYNGAKKKADIWKFNFKYWLSDNAVRIITNFICIFVLIRFYDSLNIKYELDMFLGFIVGMSIDALIIFIRKRTSINVFQTVEKELVDNK